MATFDYFSSYKIFLINFKQTNNFPLTSFWKFYTTKNHEQKIQKEKFIKFLQFIKKLWLVFASFSFSIFHSDFLSKYHGKRKFLFVFDHQCVSCIYNFRFYCKKKEIIWFFWGPRIPWNTWLRFFWLPHYCFFLPKTEAMYYVMCILLYTLSFDTENVCFYWKRCEWRKTPL